MKKKKPATSSRSVSEAAQRHQAEAHRYIEGDVEVTAAPRSFHSYRWQDGPPPSWERQHDASAEWLISRQDARRSNVEGY
jgi:hypothetical protein